MNYSSWTALLERHHRAILAASVLIGALCTFSLTRLRLDIDVLGMLPQGKPSFDEFRSFVADFGQLNQLVILAEGPELPRLQQFADALEKRLARLDTVAAVQARVDPDALLDGLLGRWVYNYIPLEAYAEVGRRLTPEAMDGHVAAARAVLAAPFDLSTARAVAGDPLGFRRLAAGPLLESYAGAAPSLQSGYFVAADGGALLVFVRPRGSAFDAPFTERLMAQVDDSVSQARAEVGGELRVDYTGSYVYAFEDAGTLRRDVGRYTFLALAGVLAVFYAGYRNLGILPFAAYPLLLNTVVTFALSLLLYEELNAVSLSFAAILYGLSIDSSVHFYTRLLLESRRQGDLRRAVAATLAALGRPNVAASATTAGAFLVIGISALTAVSEFGVLTAVGMAISTLFFFTLYPVLIFAFPGLASGAASIDTPRLERIASASAGHAGLVAGMAAGLGVAAFLAGREVRLDVELNHLRPSESAAVRVQDEIAARFGVSESSGSFVVRRRDLEVALADSEAIARRLRAYRGDGAVRSVQSIDGVLPSAAAQRARLEAFQRLPRTESAAALRAALARHGFVAERFAGFFAAFTREPDPERDLIRHGDPALAPLTALVDYHLQARGEELIVATYVEPAEGVSLREIADRMRADLPEIAFGVASRPLLQEDLADLVRSELRWFTILGVAGNLALLIVLFRRLGAAVAILVPVILAVVFLFAAMAACGVALDPVNLIVTPLLFGTGVDYGVYLAAHARECGGASAALRTGGRALVITALTTIAGFGFLAFSRYPFLATMGLLTATGLALCLVLSIVLLPALLELLDRQR